MRWFARWPTHKVDRFEQGPRCRLSGAIDAWLRYVGACDTRPVEPQFRPLKHWKNRFRTSRIFIFSISASRISLPRSPARISLTRMKREKCLSRCNLCSLSSPRYKNNFERLFFVVRSTDRGCLISINYNSAKCFVSNRCDSGELKEQFLKRMTCINQRYWAIDKKTCVVRTLGVKFWRKHKEVNNE